MIKCPHCYQTENQVKAGKTSTGSQRYKCKPCNRRYMTNPKSPDYPNEIRQQAVKLYVDGMNYRRIARHLGVDHKTVINWVKAYTAQLPAAPQPDEVVKAEMDELYTFLDQKNRVYVMTIVDRKTSCIVAWAVDTSREEATLQRMIDDAPQAVLYYSDLYATYRNLIYTPGVYTPMPDKSETFRVEGDNAEIRHYLARFARRSRCFSRCIKALREAIKLSSVHKY